MPKATKFTKSAPRPVGRTDQECPVKSNWVDRILARQIEDDLAKEKAMREVQKAKPKTSSGRS